MDLNSIVYALHLVFGLAWILLAYYGLTHPQKIPKSFFSVLIPLALAIISYHGYQLYVNTRNKYYMRHWIYLTHIVVIAGIFLYLGSEGHQANPNIYYLVAILGLFAIIHHGQKLLKSQQVEII